MGERMPVADLKTRGDDGPPSSDGTTCENGVAASLFYTTRTLNKRQGGSPGRKGMAAGLIWRREVTAIACPSWRWLVGTFNWVIGRVLSLAAPLVLSRTAMRLVRRW